jgi:hypothetical protein
MENPAMDHKLTCSHVALFYLLCTLSIYLSNKLFKQIHSINLFVAIEQISSGKLTARISKMASLVKNLKI